MKQFFIQQKTGEKREKSCCCSSSCDFYTLDVSVNSLFVFPRLSHRRRDFCCFSVKIQSDMKRCSWKGGKVFFFLSLDDACFQHNFACKTCWLLDVTARTLIDAINHENVAVLREILSFKFMKFVAGMCMNKYSYREKCVKNSYCWPLSYNELLASDTTIECSHTLHDHIIHLHLIGTFLFTHPSASDYEESTKNYFAVPYDRQQKSY